MPNDLRPVAGADPVVESNREVKTGKYHMPQDHGTPKF